MVRDKRRLDLLFESLRSWLGAFFAVNCGALLVFVVGRAVPAFDSGKRKRFRERGQIS